MYHQTCPQTFRVGRSFLSRSRYCLPQQHLIPLPVLLHPQHLPLPINLVKQATQFGCHHQRLGSPTNDSIRCVGWNRCCVGGIAFGNRFGNRFGLNLGTGELAKVGRGRVEGVELVVVFALFALGDLGFDVGHCLCVCV